MVGNKLIVEKLKKEIEKYLGVPYARNVWSPENVLIEEAVFGGKGSFEEMEYAGKCAAEKEGLAYGKMGKKEKYDLWRRNRIGIDCSGFVYRMLDSLDRIKGGSGILYKVLGVDRPYGVMGVRALSARELCHQSNSIEIKKLEEIETGDMIRFDGGKHVMLIVEKTEKGIVYVHSKGSEHNGISYQKILVKDWQKPLEDQEWLEKEDNGDNYKKYYLPENGDGVFRLKIWAGQRRITENQLLLQKR